MFFCVASTGSGKSLIYELAPIVIGLEDNTTMKIEQLNKVVIIIQPLKALMEENMSRLTQMGLSAIYVGDNTDKKTMEKILSCEYNYIFGSPESFTGDGTYSKIFLPGKFVDSIVLLVVDESHCIKKWYVYLLEIILITLI